MIFQAGKDVCAMQPVRREPLVARKSGGESAGAARRSTSASIDSGEMVQTYGWGDLLGTIFARVDLDTNTSRAPFLAPK